MILHIKSFGHCCTNDKLGLIPDTYWRHNLVLTRSSDCSTKFKLCDWLINVEICSKYIEIIIFSIFLCNKYHNIHSAHKKNWIKFFFIFF